jgi:hypothetical protein
MIKIRKEHTELLVTNGQFENLYKGLGFEIVRDNKEVPKPVIEKHVEKPVEKPVEEPVVKEPEKRQSFSTKKTKGLK